MRQAARRFDGDAADDRFAAADAAEHSAMAIRLRSDAVTLGNERIVVGAAPRLSHRETGAIFAFRRKTRLFIVRTNQQKYVKMSLRQLHTSAHFAKPDNPAQPASTPSDFHPSILYLSYPFLSL